jgi:hypothetical protein
MHCGPVCVNCGMPVTGHQWCTQDLGGGGGSTNSVDRGQREQGSGGASSLVRGFHSIFKWVKPVFWLRCYGCVFHGTGNSAQLCQNFGISGWGGWTPQSPLLRYATADHKHTKAWVSLTSEITCESSTVHTVLKFQTCAVVLHQKLILATPISNSNCSAVFCAYTYNVGNKNNHSNCIV